MKAYVCLRLVRVGFLEEQLKLFGVPMGKVPGLIGYAPVYDTEDKARHAFEYAESNVVEIETVEPKP